MSDRARPGDPWCVECGRAVAKLDALRVATDVGLWYKPPWEVMEPLVKAIRDCPVKCLRAHMAYAGYDRDWI